MGELLRLGPPSDRILLDRPYLEAGRDPACGICLPDADVSRKHASLTWTTSGWQLRDLGSTNGTFHQTGSLRVRVGEPVTLVQGDIITLGAPQLQWELVRSRRPPARAVCLEDPGMEVAEDDAREGMALPGGRIRPPNGDTFGWWLQSAQESRTVGDGDIVALGGVQWRLFLPEPQARTRRLDGPLSSARLLVVSSAPEPVRLQMEDAGDGRVRAVLLKGDQVRDLGVRAPFRLLWILAEANGAWRDQEDVLARLSTSSRQDLYNYAFRLQEILHVHGKLELRFVKNFVQLERGRVRLQIGLRA